MYMKKNPTAPPALYLTPPVIPTSVARPIDYEYLIYKRQCLCYSHRFTLIKKFDRWKVCLIQREKTYQIPLEKLPEDMSLILQSLGIKNTATYKIEIWCSEKLINKKYFTSLTNVLRHVFNNEVIMDGIAYDVE